MATLSDSTAATNEPSFRFRSLRLTYIKEWGVKSILIACSTLSVFVTLAIVVVLFTEARAFFHADDVYCNATIKDVGVSRKCGQFVGTSTPETAGKEVACTKCGALHEMPAPVTLVGFLTGTKWDPLIGGESDKNFGVWPLITGTMLVSMIAMVLALPLGLITAIYLSEYAHRRVRSIIKPTLEVLAGIPTVVYGFFALTVITPGLKLLNSGFSTYNAMAGGIAVGILCLPIVSSLVEDALQAVPRSLREGAYGLGATKFEVSTKVVVPAALSGVISAFLLAVSRAIGETMIVALAVGSRPQMSFDPRNDMQTMTGWMVQMALGDVSNYDVEYLSMYAVAALLFVITLALTFAGNLVRYRFREEYH